MEVDLVSNEASNHELEDEDECFSDDEQTHRSCNFLFSEVTSSFEFV